MSADILAFIPADATLNVDSGDGFACMVCNHWTYINGTSWEEIHTGGMFMHGREPFKFCPNCGAPILTPEQWVEHRPQDAGKTWAEIKRSIRVVYE